MKDLRKREAQNGDGGTFFLAGSEDFREFQTFWVAIGYVNVARHQVFLASR